MKKKLFFTGIAVLMAAVGLIVAGCRDGEIHPVVDGTWKSTLSWSGESKYPYEKDSDNNDASMEDEPSTSDVTQEIKFDVITWNLQKNSIDDKKGRYSLVYTTGKLTEDDSDEYGEYAVSGDSLTVKFFDPPTDPNAKKTDGTEDTDKTKPILKQIIKFKR